MRSARIVVNGAVGILALLVSFGYLTWRENKRERRPASETGEREHFVDPSTARARDRGPQCESPPLGVALSSLVRAAADGEAQLAPRPPAPRPLSELSKLAVRYMNVDYAERQARNTVLRRITDMCRDSFGDEQRLRLAYNVRLRGRTANFDLSDSVVEQGAPLTADLARCLETVASRVEVDLEDRFRDLPSFEGPAEWSILIGGLFGGKAGNAVGPRRAPQGSADLR